MTAKAFVDTNVLIYLVSQDARKAAKATELLEATPLIISVQVLNEIANVLRRKARFDWQETKRFLSTVEALTIVKPLDLQTHSKGLSLAQRYGFSVYDAMIVASALNAGCEILWSEDMQHDLFVDDRLKILNPFKV